MSFDRTKPLKPALADCESSHAEISGKVPPLPEAKFEFSSWVAPNAQRLFQALALAVGIALLCQQMPASAQMLNESSQDTRNLTQIPSVAELSDVRPSDWAYQAVVNLTERYPIVSGYLDETFKGDQSLSRYEFAAALSQLLDKIQTESIALPADDLILAERLQQEFSLEIAQLETSVDNLAARTRQLEAQQFSPTVQLSGQLIVAATAGGYAGDRIIAPRGALVTDESADTFFLNRAALFFNASFTGEDQLQIRLLSGSNGPLDNVAGSLEPNFGSTLDYAVQGRDNSLSIARAFYSFYPDPDLQVVIGPLLVMSDYVDSISSQPPSFQGFSTQAMANNFILFPTALGAGAVLDWNPNGGDFSFRAAYVATDTDNTSGENSRLIGGGGSDDVRLFPTGGGSSAEGLFGDPHQGFVEVEYAPSEAFALRLQYTGGQIFGSNFDGAGINAEVMLSPQIALFGRYGTARYSETTLDVLSPQYWMTGLTYADLFKQGDLTGVAVVQPFIEAKVGNATQTSFESFYYFPIADAIDVSPFVQVVVNPANQDSNGTITVGGIKTVFSF